MSDFAGFDHVNLVDIDPTFKPVEQAVYNLEITKAETRTYTNKTTQEEEEYISLQLTIVNDATYSGRKLFESLFSNKFTLIALRKIMDATGIAQEYGEPLIDWLKRVAAEKGQFSTLVEKVPDINRKTGVPNPRTAITLASGEVVAAEKNQVNWREVRPVA